MYFIREKKCFYFCVGVLLNIIISSILLNFVIVLIYKVNEKILYVWIIKISGNGKYSMLKL